jgi:hypothetical protein
MDQTEWARDRSFWESVKHERSRFGQRRKPNERMLYLLSRCFLFVLKGLHLYHKGHDNARKSVLNRITFNFPTLPILFNGYKILHLSDLHLDGSEEIEAGFCHRINGLDYDLSVFDWGL